MIFRLAITYFRGTGGPAIFQGAFKRRKPLQKLLSIISLLYFFYVVFDTLFYRFTLLLEDGLGGALRFHLMYSLLFCAMMILSSSDELLLTGSDLSFLIPLPLTHKELVLSRYLILLIEALIDGISVLSAAIFSSIAVGVTSAWWYLALVFTTLSAALFTVSFSALLTYLGNLNVVFAFIKRVLKILSGTSVFGYLLFILNDKYGNDVIAIIVAPGIRIEELGFPLAADLFLILLSMLFIMISLTLSRNMEPKAMTTRSGFGGYGRKCREHSQLVSMILREWRMVSSHHLALDYAILNCIPLILLLFFRFASGQNQLPISSGLPLYTAALLIFISGSSNISTTSVSREGGDFNYSKVLPISIEKRVQAKVLFNLLYVLPFQLAALIPAFLIARTRAGEGCAIMFSTIASTAATSLIGLSIDYRNPCTDWVRISQLSRSLNTFIAFLLNCLFLALLVIISAILYRSAPMAVFCISISFLPLILDILLYRICIRGARKLYMER